MSPPIPQDPGRRRRPESELAGTPWSSGVPPLSDEELCELALAADPDEPVEPDAMPIAAYLGQVGGLLPGWYMPAPMTRRAARWRRVVVLALVALFVTIEAAGLCSTFGQLVPG